MTDTVSRIAAERPVVAPRTRLRAAMRDDHAAVMALFKRHNWPVRSREGWDWALFDSPAREAASADAGWVLEHGSDIVGFLGNLPVLCRYDGAPVWGATCTSYLVDDRHRAHSTRLMRAFAAQPGAAFAYSATANACSAPVYKGFRFREAPCLQVNERMRWLAHEGVAAGALANRLGLHAVSPWIAGMASACSAVLRTVVQTQRDSGLVVQRLLAEDLLLRRANRWPQTWNNWASTLWRGPGLWVDRSASTIGWRMSDPDLADDLAVWSLSDSTGRMWGMAMARKLDAIPNRAPRAELVDWALASGAPAGSAELLLQTVKAWARSWRLACVDAKRWTGLPAEQLRTLSPRVSALPSAGVWLLVNRQPGRPELPEWPHWGMTGADSDDWFCTHQLTPGAQPRPWLRPASAQRSYHFAHEVTRAAESSATSSGKVFTAEGSKRIMSSV